MEKIENKKYNKLLRVGKTFNNYTFNNCTFESVAFSQCTFVNCTFVNCTFSYCQTNNSSFINSGFINCDFDNGSVNNSKFIACSFSLCNFFDFPVVGNEFLNCWCSGLEFTNNTEVTNNIFDELTGNIEMCDCVGAFDNTFKNMDFSGFVNFYYQSLAGLSGCLSRVDWVRNRFINTTVSVDAIMELAKKAKVFGYPHWAREGFVCKGHAITLDMRNLSDEARFVITANAPLRLPSLKETNRAVNMSKGTLSHDLHLSAIDNDYAPIIVDKAGRVLKPCAIPRIDVKTHFSGKMGADTALRNVVQVDDNEYGIDFNDDSIYESSKHYVKKEINLS